MNENLIAYCGMNCGLCYANQRSEKKCNGCVSLDSSIPNSCKRCIIKKCCDENNYRFCYECSKYPCLRLRQLDKRYKTKYHMSMIENLEMIKEQGILNFLKKEQQKWKCKNCDEIVCVHKKICKKCLFEYNFN